MLTKRVTGDQQHTEQSKGAHEGSGVPRMESGPGVTAAGCGETRDPASESIRHHLWTPHSWPEVLLRSMSG